uniref:Beta-lactamase-related domain-containing protein n=1 Tax=Oxyrrhis marina TaxID=2969 RepID=A0A7S4GNC5_OXYMA
MPSLRFLGEHGALAQALTTPGTAVHHLGNSGRVVVRNQTASVLGWTCGNMVGRAQDVARFFWDLLGPSDSRILSEESLAFMRRYQPMTVGWGKLANVHYGAGLMAVQGALKPGGPGADWGFYEGHGGATYGFTSSQGFIPKASAAFSLVTNTGAGKYSAVATCRLLVALAESRGERAELGCGEVLLV